MGTLEFSAQHCHGKEQHLKHGRGRTLFDNYWFHLKRRQDCARVWEESQQSRRSALREPELAGRSSRGALRGTSRRGIDRDCCPAGVQGSTTQSALLLRAV